MSAAIKDYLGSESARNKINADVYTALVKRAFPGSSVLIGHHICFQHGTDISTENEIPAADSLIFDHEIMTACFGERALGIMQELAAVPADRRDAVLRRYCMDAFPIDPQCLVSVD